MNIRSALRDIENEHSKAHYENGPLNSLHEGYGLLVEEVDELFDEIKRSPRNRHPANIRHEAAQVAAMALAIMLKA